MEKKYYYSLREGRFGDEIYVKERKVKGYTGYFRDFENIIAEGKSIKETQTKLWNAAYDIFKNFMNK